MGFDNDCILNIQLLIGEYFCALCRMLVYPNEALQSQCTHLYCNHCLAYVASNTRACPYDGYLVTEADSKPLVESNKTLAETIGKVAVRCLYYRSGCTWQGQFSECITHCTGCAFGNSPVVCNRCATQMLHRQVQDHSQHCPGVQPQAQQAMGNQNATTTTGATSTEQSQAAAQVTASITQTQDVQSAVLPASGQDQTQANITSKSQTAVEAIPTPEQLYQQQQYYQQYVVYYPGYPQYQQHPTHSFPGQQTQMYMQQALPQPQVPICSKANVSQSQSQSQTLPHSQLQVQTQPQPHSQPQQALQHAQIGLHPQVQTHFNMPIPPQPYHTHPQQPQVHSQPQPHQIHPQVGHHFQQQTQVRPQQQLNFQPHQQTYRYPQSQPLAQTQFPQPQDQLQARPQTQTHHPSHAVIGHQSYPQHHPNLQLPPGPPQLQNFHMHPHQQSAPTQWPQPTVHMQPHFMPQQTVQMRPPHYHSHVAMHPPHIMLQQHSIQAQPEVPSLVLPAGSNTQQQFQQNVSKSVKEIPESQALQKDASSSQDGLDEPAVQNMLRNEVSEQLQSSASVLLPETVTQISEGISYNGSKLDEKSQLEDKEVQDGVKKNVSSKKIEIPSGSDEKVSVDLVGSQGKVLVSDQMQDRVCAQSGHVVPVSDSQQLQPNCGHSHMQAQVHQRPPQPDQLPRLNSHPQQLQIPGPPPAHLRPPGNNLHGSVLLQGPPSSAPAHFQQTFGQILGSFCPEISPASGLGPGSIGTDLGPFPSQGNRNVGPMPAHYASRDTAGGTPFGGPPPGPFDSQGHIMGRMPPQGMQMPDAEFIASNRRGYLDGRLPGDLPVTTDRIQLGHPWIVQLKNVGPDGGSASGPSNPAYPFNLHEERFKHFPEDRCRQFPEVGLNPPGGERLNNFPAESDRRGTFLNPSRLGDLPLNSRPGFNASMSGYGSSDGGFFNAGEVDSLDHSRKRKHGSMGWCRICKVDCETVDSLEMHSQSRDHQKMAMDIVLNIKDNAKKQKVSTEDHISHEGDANKSRKASINHFGRC